MKCCVRVTLTDGVEMGVDFSHSPVTDELTM